MWLGNECDRLRLRRAFQTAIDARGELAVDRRWERGSALHLGLRRRRHLPERSPGERSLAELVPADLPADDRQLVDEDDLARDLLVRAASARRTGGARPRAARSRSAPALGTTNARTKWPPRWRSRMPTTAAAAIAGCPVSTRSTSNGPNVPAAARDHVLRAADEREEALLVDVRDVAGQVPVAEERGLRLLRQLPVAGEQGRRPAADGEVALDPGGKLVALVVDDRDVMAGKRAAERAGLEPRRRRGSRRRCSSRPGRSRRRWSCPSAPRTRRRPRDRGSRRSRRDGGGEASGSARASGAPRGRGTRPATGRGCSARAGRAGRAARRRRTRPRGGRSRRRATTAR